MRSNLFKISLIAFALIICCLVSETHAKNIGVINPYFAFRDAADISFNLGYDLAATVTSDGKYFYVADSEVIKLYGTGYQNTLSGQYFGSITAPFNTYGTQSVLFYLPKRSSLVIWKYNDNTIYSTNEFYNTTHPIKWKSFTPKDVNLKGASLSFDDSDVYIFDRSRSIIDIVSGDEFLKFSSIQLNDAKSIVNSHINENGHSFAFDGDHFYFGVSHSGNCYSIYTKQGEYIDIRCYRLHGSMLVFNWALGYYGSCGNDQSPAPAFHELTINQGRGAHCSFWRQDNTEAHIKPTPYPSCSGDVPQVYGRYIDQKRIYWSIYQNGCRLTINRDSGKKYMDALLIFNDKTKEWTIESRVFSTLLSTLAYSTVAKIAKNGDLLFDNKERFIKQLSFVKHLIGGEQGILPEEFDKNATATLLKSKYIYIAYTSKTLTEGFNKEALSSYDYIVRFSSIGTTNTTRDKVSSKGKGAECDDIKTFLPVRVSCIYGDCKMPSDMLWGRKQGQVCFGSGIGLVSRPTHLESEICDATIGKEDYRAIYLQRGGTDGQALPCHGVKNIDYELINPTYMSIFTESYPDDAVVDQLRKRISKLHEEHENLVEREKELVKKIQRASTHLTTPGPDGPEGDQGETGEPGIDLIGEEGPRGPTAYPKVQKAFIIPDPAPQPLNEPDPRFDLPTTEGKGRLVFVRGAAAAAPFEVGPEPEYV